MSEITLNSVKLSNGETYGYRKSGEGNKVLVLVHGNMSSSKHWDLVMENLPSDYTTYAIDMRGFGVSSYNTPINSLKDLSEDLKLFVDAIGLKNFYLAGWSTGGGVAMHFSIDYPEHVEKLILVESVGIKGYPIFKKDVNGQPIIGEFLNTKEEIAKDPIQVVPILSAYENKDRNMLRATWDALIYVFGKPEEERYEAYIDEMLKQRNLVDIDYSLVHFNISDEHNGVVEGSGGVHKIKAPTLVIQGKEDIVVPMNMGIGIAEGIGEKARLELLDNGGHSPMTDDLDRFMNLILDFMN
ncbi:Pimeloyl-ACP methyl ester carboxylesterase [Proteiniborus ethanoligenes]|uniref:Pimeloyl-ACP methyl ester carboxylesterase n=1 Tax=Proteiniborus ethanoligenes TaxID=415015 RepID=A0A1H3JS97_9FIRM|nr:alpha/beta hydrolase [Proteiniborus ethanoligenes]SDY42796.1 Pimeloyl-ACP methyl ester carboxylesterase [Proteiniborus ethanoligenes]